MQNDQEKLKQVWKLAQQMRISMLTTWDGAQQNSRPMASHPDPDANAIYFLTSVDSPKEAELAQFPEVSLIYMDTGAHKYLKFSGRAVSSNDRPMIKKLWSVFAKTWFETPDDPNIRLITFTPHSAELWDSPGALVSATIMLTNAALGTHLSVGTASKVKMSG